MDNLSKNDILLKYIGIEDKGFTKVIFKDDFIDNFYGNLFQRKIDNRIEVLFYAIRNNKVLVGEWLILESVEGILEPILRRNNLSQTHHVEDLLKTIIPPRIKVENDISSLLGAIGRIELSSDENIREVSKLMLEYIQKATIPFWEKYSSLQFLNDELIDIVPQQQLADYIPSFMPLKKLIIMKLGNNVNYSEYADWLNKIYEEMVEDEPLQYTAEYKAYQELCDFLNGV